MIRKQLRIAVFASGPVGLEVLRLFKTRGYGPEFVVTNPEDIDVADVIGSEPYVFARGEEASLAAALQEKDIDLGVLAWWPWILPMGLIDATRLGFLNLHPSLLPLNRGKDPNFWTIRDGTPAGVTIHFVSPGVDDGDIAFQKRLSLSWEDTGRTLYERSQRALVDLLGENLDLIVAGSIPRVPQDHGSATMHRRSDLESASVIDLDADYRARDLLDLLRARTFPPHPGASFEESGVRYQVRVEITRRDDADPS